MSNMLQGIRVLDMTEVLGGPWCTLLLSDFGAEVIKVERPKRGDAYRWLPPFASGGMSYWFAECNRDKKSITLNLSTEEGRDLLKELAKKSQVFIENHVPGAMTRLGLNYEEIRRVNPSIIYCSISGYGQTGPYRDRIAYEYAIQSASGVMALTGELGGPPLRVGIPIADLGAGLHAAIAILAALIKYKDTGAGTWIDLSMQDCLWTLVALNCFPLYQGTGKMPERLGNWTEYCGPVNVYRTKDTDIMITCVNEWDWRNLARAIGKPELGMPGHQFYKRKERLDNRAVIDQMIQEWLADKTFKEVESILTREKVPFAELLPLDMLLEHPQLVSRDMITEFEQPGVGRLKIPGTPFKFVGDALEIGLKPAPFLGQDNNEIYSQVLGLNQDEVEKLKERGVI